MLLNEVKKLSPLDRLIYWIKERYSIYLKKQAGQPKPWTDDCIIQSYRFCNVRRMDDRVSQWLLKNWYEPNFGHKNMLLACVLARHFNLPTSLHAIGFPTRWEPERIKRILRSVKASGKTIFNGAYMVRGMSKKEPNRTAIKSDQVIDLVCQPLIASPPSITTTSVQLSVEALLPYWGFSTFMAGQVVADLRWATSGSWADARSWAPVGPGSSRGMNWLHSRPITKLMPQKQFLDELRALIVLGTTRLPRDITERMEAMDWQNCLCEFDKYSRTILHEGHPKQRYQGT